MEIYIINGQRIELTEEQIAEIERFLGVAKVKLADIPVGETFKIGKYEFIVLEQYSDETAIILKDLIKKSEKFGDCNNFNDSNADHICKKFADEIEGIVGVESLTLHTVDLTSDDGLKCYGVIERKMSLLTTEMYRYYVEILDRYKLDKWWWLATAYSTPKHDNDNWVKCVAPSGGIYFYSYYDVIGVRPFCILKSNIFVIK